MRNQQELKEIAEIERLVDRAQKQKIKIRHPRRPRGKSFDLKWDANVAFNPEPLKLPKNYVALGGLPIKRTPKGPIIPDIPNLRHHVPIRLRPWGMADWKTWLELTRNNCRFVPQKTMRAEIPVLPPTRLCKVSHDCARVYTVNDSGEGCVINVLTESVENSFTVQPDTGADYPVDLPGAPVVNPFTKGGFNNKYNRLYVPASFYTVARSGRWGGFYVAVVDANPCSETYLNTIDYIDCGWIPEEIAFTEDEETGVISNYMQGTATIFRASDGSVLAQEVDCFDGARDRNDGGPWARSVRCAKVPRIGNRAFVTLTNSSPAPGVAIIDLDKPGYPRTNFRVNDFIDGVAVTPDQRRILLVGSSAKLYVVKVDEATPQLERTIDLPGTSYTYFGGITVRPSGDLAFLATGVGDISSPTQGTALIQVNYMSGTVLESPNGLAPQTWGLDIKSFGQPLKPHIFVCSLSGMLTIIPC